MPITRKRYQSGTLQKVPRANGPDVWVYRWRQLMPDGRRVQRKQTIGTVKKYKTESDAKKAAESLRLQANAEVPLTRPDEGPITFGGLWGHFQKYELDARLDARSPTTIECYQNNLRLYVLPKWKDTPVVELKAVSVEQWLGTLQRNDGGPLAPGTKVKLRNQMRVIFDHALRHEQIDPQVPNPFKLVRQGGQRLRTPDTLTIDEIKAILSHIDSHLVRTAIFVAAETGLRRSELRGLKWSDVMFGQLWIKVERGVVDKLLTRGKTEESRRGVPMTEALASILTKWREASLYGGAGDWVFASAQTGGKTSYWLGEAVRQHIRPAVEAAKINKRVGWHTMRHSLGTILADSGESMKTTQGLLRHKQIATTANIYTRDNEDSKRSAQGKMKGMYLVKTGS
jgi:integrase